MPNQEFDFNVGRPAPTGWRLERLEMANWGTFGEGHVHSLVPGGAWTLLVGENGSGKSTAIDALRTLLAPRASLHHSFNDAAGGQKRKDRSLVTYIRGAWATQREDEDAPTEIKFLRKEETPTFLLAVFRNSRTQAALTIGQILWVSNGGEETIYLVAGGEMGIAENLQGLETGRGLKKELQRRGFDVRDSYRAYREDFCGRMGIPGEGALEIFNQAIGVKEVSDVSIFLRRNLLTPGGAPDFIRRQVIPRFSDLEGCWNDIERAERQIALLEPVASAQVEVTDLEAKREEIYVLQRALPLYYLQRHVGLLREHLDRCALELSTAKAAEQELESRREAAEETFRAAVTALSQEKSEQRIRELDLEIGEVKLRAAERQQCHEQLATLLGFEELGSVPIDEQTFVAMREQLSKRRGELEHTAEDETLRANEEGVKAGRLKVALREVQEELDSLVGRQALIPAYLQQIRAALSQASGVPLEDLPFAGELIEIKPEYAGDWSGALERLLHNFGISLLVPERHYPRVARWVNGRRLVNAAGDGVRLVFHRVTTDARRASSATDPKVVLGRLNFREEHPLARWVASEVEASFPHTCCRNEEELERARFGLTKEGLIRNGTRHVKDDRRALGSRRDYVLGWSPEGKIEALREQRNADTQALAKAQTAEKNGRRKVAELQQRVTKLAAAETLEGFARIDFTEERELLVKLAQRRAELEKSSKLRATLKEQVDEAKEAVDRLLRERDGVMETINEKRRQLNEFRPKLDDLEQRLDRSDPQDFTALAPAFIEAEGNKEVTHLSIELIQERIKASLGSRAGNFSNKIKDAQQVMIAPMQKFLNAYPDETKALDAKPEYAPEFVALHNQLVREDLPRHKERFRDFLNTNLTESIGGLEAMLDAEVKTHRDRIQQVNQALRGLEYSAGTFVEISRRDSREQRIRDFKARLRDCLSAGLSPDENQRLELYKKIREIVVRFAQEPEWMKEVVDSRLWLEFSVNERRKSDGVSVDDLGSSTGKSGGQKAKMAFTILAASLLAQYGLADDPERVDSFRLVVVDEVFARTDAQNSHRALELFQRLGFQLLLAAPWKAEARIAERYVESFHLTVNPNGDASRVRRATRAQYEAARPAQANPHGQS